MGEDLVLTLADEEEELEKTLAGSVNCAPTARVEALTGLLLKTSLVLILPSRRWLAPV